MSRTKGEYASNNRAVYDRFCEKYPDIDISYTKWREIVRTFNCLLRDYIVTTGEKVKLPWGLGSLAIAKYKKKKLKMVDGKEYINLAIDWAKTKAAGKRIYHLNNHTEGHNFKWQWFCSEANGVPFQEIWHFKPVRGASRGLAGYINKPGRNFEKYKQYRPNK